MQKYRLVTRSDFDGLVCAILLKHLNMIDDILFVHPKDMQDGKITITSNDITTNLPYVKECYLSFDHHLSETKRNEKADNHIIKPDVASAARVLYDYYGGTDKFPAEWHDMMLAVDKSDSAQFDLEEILHPKGWVLLNFLMDARTGLGRFREFRVSNYELMMSLIDACATHSIDQILELDDVKERSELYFEHESKAIEQIKRCSQIHKNLIVLDLRNEEIIWTTNRFMIYALFPDTNISLHMMWGLKKQNTVFAIGKSILNRTSNTSIGELCLQYGGGGHENAGTCQVEHDDAEVKLKDIITSITTDG